MLKKVQRRYRRYRYVHQYDYPAMFMSIGLMVGLLKLLGVAAIAYGLYLTLT